MFPFFKLTTSLTDIKKSKNEFGNIQISDHLNKKNNSFYKNTKFKKGSVVKTQIAT